MWTALLATIFPERADHRIVRLLTAEDLLRLVQPTQRNTVTTLLPFNEPIVRATIHEAKFQKNERAWELLGFVLATYLKHQPSDIVILPIPLSYERYKERGYNQVYEVVRRALRQTPHIRLNAHCLVRSKHTKAQTSLTRKERFANLTDAFDIRQVRELKDAHVILIDDVVTTGATLAAAQAALLPHKPASISLLALAH